MKHFTPDYNPWDQRLCVVPDGDLFKILREGHAIVETDQIASFTETGVQLKSGKHLDADIIVSATGLEYSDSWAVFKPQLMVSLLDTSKHMLYQGVMVSDVPNMAMIIGYINASWTLESGYGCGLYLPFAQLYGSTSSYDEVIPQGDADRVDWKIR